MPKRAKYCLPWYSYRSTVGAVSLLCPRAVRRVGWGLGERVLRDDGGQAPSASSRWSRAPDSHEPIESRGAPGVKTWATPCSCRTGMSASGMIPPTMTSTSPRPTSLNSLTTLGHQGEVGPGEQRQADGVGVLLHDGLDHLLGSLVQAGVDDLEPGVTQRPGDHLGPAVVAVEARLGHDHPVGTFHASTRIRMPWSGRQTGNGQARRSGRGRQQQVLLADRVEAHRGLGPRPLALGADDDAAAPVVVHHLVAGDQAEVFGARAATASGDPGGAVGATAPSRPGPGGGRQGDGRREDGAGQVLLAREGVVARAAARRPKAHVLDQVGGHLGDEPAGHGRLGAAPGRARPGVRNGEMPAGPGDPDVEEPALLLELARLGERAEVREDPLLQAHHEDRRILQALGRVQRHQRDPGAVAVELVGVRHQRHRLEEAEDVIEVGRPGWPARPGSQSVRPPRGCARPPARPGSPCARPPAARSRPG